MSSMSVIEFSIIVVGRAEVRDGEAEERPGGEDSRNDAHQGDSAEQ